MGRCLLPYQVASWSIQPFGHNAWTDNWDCCAPFCGLVPHLTQCCLPPYQVASSSIQPFTTTDMGRKSVGLYHPHFWGRGLGPHLTHCGVDRRLPSRQVSCRSIQPLSHNRPTSQTGQDDRQTDRQTGQRSDSVGRTVFARANRVRRKITESEAGCVLIVTTGSKCTQ